MPIWIVVQGAEHTFVGLFSSEDDARTFVRDTINAGSDHVYRILYRYVFV